MLTLKPGLSEIARQGFEVRHNFSLNLIPSYFPSCGEWKWFPPLNKYLWYFKPEEEEEDLRYSISTMIF